MMNSIKRFPQRPGIVGWLIIVNVAMWVAMRLCVAFGADSLVGALALPGDAEQAMLRPWTLFTYMWLHYDLLHITGNMVMLYYLGRICDTLGQTSLVLPTYIIGGILGALGYIAVALADQALVGSALVGASAAVIAVGVFDAFTAPRLRFGVWLLGEVELRWIVLVVVALMCIGATAASIGNLLAHLAGAVAGIGMHYYRKSKARRSSLKPNAQQVTMEQVDRVLDKVKRSGYSSLNASERRVLFVMSNRLNRK